MIFLKGRRLNNSSARLIIFLLHRAEESLSLRVKVCNMVAYLSLFFTQELLFCFAFLSREETQTVHPSGPPEADTSSIRSRCIPRLYAELTNEQETDG